MNSNENKNDAKIPIPSRIRALKPPIEHKMNEINVIAPAVLSESRIPANIAVEICENPDSRLM